MKLRVVEDGNGYFKPQIFNKDSWACGSSWKVFYFPSGTAIRFSNKTDAIEFCLIVSNVAPNATKPTKSAVVFQNFKKQK